MPIYNPSEYKCSNLLKHQHLIIMKRDWLYRIIRKLLLWYKPRINVIYKGKQVNPYQEDCVILEDLEMKCQLRSTQDVKYTYRSSYTSITSLKKFKEVIVGLENITLKLDNSSTITFPTNVIKTMIERQNYILTTYDSDIIMDVIDDGSYIIKRIIRNQLESWHMMYCPICGKPVVATFNTDGVDIKNECICGNSQPKADHMTYSEFSIWLSSDINKLILKYNKKLWIK